ncbi:Gp49 family protein [Pseudomonas syringae]|uniref:Gp49 family protein n=1 Tax=Pseudomonas syringae TaxID=317 RepID=UPI003211F1ED
MSDSAIEKEIQEKGLTAPRVTPSDLQANIASEHYFTAADGAYGAEGFQDFQHARFEDQPAPLHLLTFCVLVLRNGFTVTGESACASPENFNADIGRKIARQNAEQKIWPLMGYELKQRLHERAHQCQGKNCHASAGDAETQHSLECQEETTYTYAGIECPATLDCEKLLQSKWANKSGAPELAGNSNRTDSLA